MVALHPEGVDRNFHGFHRFSAADWSPSTRRAWIEIVDFNKLKASGMSPSTRRAWIEI